jgi:TRAP transporter TAXI family solute receptor
MVFTLRGWLPAAILATTFITGASSLTVAQERVDLIAGPFNTGSYVLSNALEQITKTEDSAVVVTATETPGLVYNAKALTSDEAMRQRTMMSFTAGINYLATEAEGPFEEPLESAMLIANYNLGTVWLATFDENIRTPQDLVGKRIALGRPPQILWTIEPRLVIRHGWDLEDQITIETLGTTEAAQALLNGSVDAAVIGGYANPETGEFLPSPQTVELLASGRTLYHIPWGEEAIAKTMEIGVPLVPADVPAGAVDGLEETMASFYDTVAWAAYPDFDEDAAYQITKTIIANVEKFAEYHALGKLMTEAVLPYGWPVERIHPGALRAYREAGLIE